MTSENEYRLGRRAYQQDREESVGAILAVVALVVLGAGVYILVHRFHLRPAQLVEGSLYLLYVLVAAISVAWYALTLRKRRELNWPHPPLFIGQAKDRKAVNAANEQNAIVLGYDVHGKPWLWPDATRVISRSSSAPLVRARPRS